MSDNSLEPIDEADLTRRAARQMIDHLSESMKTVLSEIGALGRWLTASLLAVNGASALAIFNASEKLAHPRVDGGPFAAGVLAALLAGVLLQRASIRGAAMAGEIIGHSILVEQTGVMHPEAKRLAETMNARAQRNGKWPQIAGWVSAVLFAIGASLTAWTGPASTSPTTRDVPLYRLIC